MPWEIENCRVLILDNIYGYLWKERVPLKEVDLNRKSVACNRSVAFLHVTCNTSGSGGIFSKVISFDFSVKGHTIYPQQAGCSCFVPGGLIQGFKNRARIGIWYFTVPESLAPFQETLPSR